MKKLLKLQFRNIFHNKLFYVCFGLTLLTSSVITFVTGIAFKSVQPSTVFKEIMSLMTSEVGIVNMLFITLFCTYDYNEGTTKNIIGRGYSKIQLLFSKYISCFISLFIMYGIIIAIDFVLFINNGLGFESSMIPLFIYSIFKILAYTVLYGTIAFVLEKNSSAIITNLIFPKIAMLLLTFADSSFKIKISQFWIENIGNKFTANPTFGGLFAPIITYMIYTAIFIFIGSRILKNKEIK